MVSMYISEYTRLISFIEIFLLQVTVDSIMLPSPLSNCQEDVDQFLLTLDSISEAAHPPAQAPNPSVRESLPQKVLALLAVTKYTPEKIFSIVDVNFVTYISGYIVRKIRDKLCAVCQQRLMSSIDTSKPSHLFISLKAHSDAKDGLVTPSPELQQLVQDLESTYHDVYANILHMNCVRARFIRRLMEVAKRAMLECEDGLCNPPPLIVGLFVNIRLHHSLRKATKDITNNKTRRNRKLMKFSHCWSCYVVLNYGVLNTRL